MKQVSRLLMMLVITVILNACWESGDQPLNPGPEPEQETQRPRILVEIVNSKGNPFRPDRVYWWADRQGGPLVETEAICANSTCTVWAINDSVQGQVYIAANHHTVSPDDSDCWINSQNSVLLDSDTAVHHTIILSLVEVEICL